MKKSLFSLIFLILVSTTIKSQIIYPQGGALGGALFSAADKIVSEYGFLPGKKFPLYNTVEKFDFKGRKIKIILTDDRYTANLEYLDCSKIPLKNSFELSGEQGIVKFWQYINKLADDSSLKIDENSDDTYEISLMALDARLIGSFSIAVHGLCQMKVKHNGSEKIYCVDLEDGDKNAPLSKSSFATRKTATRLMTSAAIREMLEKFLEDLKLNSI